MSTPVEPEADAFGHTRTRAQRSVARGLLRPTSLAVVAGFAAVGALLPPAFRPADLAGRMGSGAHAAYAQRQAAGPHVDSGLGATPHPADLPADLVATPVGAATQDGSGVAGTDTAAADTVAPLAVSQTPTQPAPTPPPHAVQPAPAPAPPPAPTPASILNVQQPTPLGPVGVVATTTPTAVTLTAPAAGTVTLTSPVALP